MFAHFVRSGRPTCLKIPGQDGDLRGGGQAAMGSLRLGPMTYAAGAQEPTEVL